MSAPSNAMDKVMTATRIEIVEILATECLFSLRDLGIFTLNLDLYASHLEHKVV